jgi:hypothetical protein
VDSGFKGAVKVFTADTPYVGDDFNDKLSSLVVEKIPTFAADGVTVFEGPYFTGKNAKFKEGKYSTISGIGDNTASSLYVPKGYAVVTYEDANMKGASIGFGASTVKDLEVPTLPEKVDNTASSIMVSRTS